MNTKFFFSLSVVAVAFALVLGLGTFNAAKAVPGENGKGYNLPAGQTNLFGYDAAHNGLVVSDRDRDAQLRANEFESYGLWGTSQE